MFTITENNRIFDIFTIKSLQGFTYNFDGPVGRRVLFIESKDKHFTVSFEEGMDCLDLRKRENSDCNEAEYQNGSCYIHQLHNSCTKAFAFFHFEYLDEKGEKLILPGQLFAKEGYTWSEHEVEPILVELMNSISPAVEENTLSVSHRAESSAENSLWQKIKQFIS